VADVIDFVLKNACRYQAQVAKAKIPTLLSSTQPQTNLTQLQEVIL